MIYYFYCEKCGNTEEFVRPMADGPPRDVKCIACHLADDADVNMIHEIGGQFILKGGDWPSKDMKSSQYHSEKAREEIDNQHAEDSRNQRIVDEVMDVRRQGHNATEQLRKSNPQKLKDYQNAIKKGYRAKSKTFQAKGKDYE